jgi:hypothetical protein
MTLNQSHAVTSNVSTDAAAKPAAPPSPHPGTPTSTSGSSTTTTSRPLEVLVPRTWKGEEGDAIPGLPGLYVGPCFGSGALAYNHIHDVLTGGRWGRPAPRGQGAWGRTHDAEL